MRCVLDHFAKQYDLSCRNHGVAVLVRGSDRLDIDAQYGKLDSDLQCVKPYVSGPGRSLMHAGLPLREDRTPCIDDSASSLLPRLDTVILDARCGPGDGEDNPDPDLTDTAWEYEMAIPTS